MICSCRGRRRWDKDKIRNVFNAIDASLILSLPLSNSGMNGFWGWSFEKKRDYIVRSAHQLLHKED